MPKKESIQQKLKRIRPPRVQITYDVEIGGAIEMKELPFVVGVLGDFSGQPVQPLPRIKDRKLIEIDRDNFDQVLAAQAPRLALRVDNKLTDDGSKMNVEMKFNNMLDFEPDQVVQQVEPLRKLVEARQKLRDILSKTDGNDKLETMLTDLLKDPNAQKQLGKQLGLTQDDADEGGKKEPHE
ncbi:MAG: type VI secretion system contractile sheath small subunit [Acidithiobacillales bacterium]